VKEGEFCKQGLNWRRSSDTWLCLLLKIWRFNWYFRIRDKRLCQPPNSCKHIVFSFNYVNLDEQGYSTIFSNFKYNWEMRAFKFGDCVVSEELLADFIETVGTPTGTHIDYMRTRY
jgi:hypothetical protein